MIDAKKIGDKKKNFLVGRQTCYLFFLGKIRSTIG